MKVRPVCSWMCGSASPQPSSRMAWFQLHNQKELWSFSFLTQMARLFQVYGKHQWMQRNLPANLRTCFSRHTDWFLCTHLPFMWLTGALLFQKKGHLRHVWVQALNLESQPHTTLRSNIRDQELVSVWISGLMLLDLRPDAQSSPSWPRWLFWTPCMLVPRL